MEEHAKEELQLRMAPIRVGSKVNPFLEKLVGLESVGKDESVVGIDVGVSIDLLC